MAHVQTNHPGIPDVAPMSPTQSLRFETTCTWQDPFWQNKLAVSFNNGADLQEYLSMLSENSLRSEKKVQSW